MRWLPKRHTRIRSHVRWVASCLRTELADRLTGDAMVIKNCDIPAHVDLSGGDSYLLGCNSVASLAVVGTAAAPAHVNFGGALTVNGAFVIHDAVLSEQ